MDRPVETLHHPNGDVRVIVSAARQYQLHSSILRRASPVLRELLNEKNAAELSKKAIKKGVTRRFCLFAMPNREQQPDVEYTLTAVPLNSEGQPTVSLPMGLDLENARAIPPVFIAYEAVLGAFYAKPVHFGSDDDDNDKTNMAGILHDAYEIIKVADYLCCMPAINRLIEAPLLSQGQVLFQSIANMPIVWLMFANRLRSRAIFQQALIHAAGRYNDPAVRDALANPELDAELRNIVLRKGRELSGKIQLAFLHSISYYPQDLQRERREGRADKDTIGRDSYARDIMTWIALTVLRQWLSQQLIIESAHTAHDMGTKTIRLILAGGEAYLSKFDLEAFHKLFPTSSKGENKIYHKLREMKQHIKTFFNAFNLNHSLLNADHPSAGHLTCTIVNIEDIPFCSVRSRDDPPVAHEGEDENDANTQNGAEYESDDDAKYQFDH